ncbi:Biotin biosynthesis cytochrome P450 [compost metagenome]
MSLFAPPDQQLQPYAFYADRRQHLPVHFDARQDAWGVYRYAEVKAVLTDYANFSSEIPQARSDEGFRESLINVDPPRHRQLRGVIAKAFTPGAIAQLGPRIEAIAHDLLDVLDTRERFDLVNAFAHPLPVMIIAELLGIPAEDRPQYKEWADGLLAGDGETMLRDEARRERALRIVCEMDDYFRVILASRRRRPQDDLITQLLVAEVDGERLSEDQILSFCMLLLVAGHVTTVNLITNGMICLLEQSEALNALRQAPAGIPRALEEVLRYRSPVQWLMRVARNDLILGGERVSAGQTIIAFVGSANRDEAVFSEPERFDVTRHPNPHLSFGHGVHFCLGAPLARLEAQVALQVLFARLNGFQLDLLPGEELHPLGNSLLYGVSHLPMRADRCLVA